MAGRQHERVTINDTFESFEDFVGQYVANVSKTGVFIKTRHPLPIGTEVDLRVTVVTDTVGVLEGTATVVRLDTEPPGMGVEFKELTPESRALIDQLVAVVDAPITTVRSRG